MSELSPLLRSLFRACDESSAGEVSSGKLLDHLLRLVEMPAMERWRVDRLGQMMDPRQDDRSLSSLSSSLPSL